eukprot:m.17272 g.17272  ORF g.17272 m.17272 type:complete len:391 (-) comp3477_c0_seq2:305-1477(-)
MDATQVRGRGHAPRSALPTLKPGDSVAISQPDSLSTRATIKPHDTVAVGNGHGPLAVTPTVPIDRATYLDPIDPPPVAVVSLDSKAIPEFDMSTTHLDSASDIEAWATTLREAFFDKAGCVVLRNVFPATVMDEYNAWCESHLDEVAKTHANSRHPKQKDKRIINDVMERMSTDRPDLFMTLLNNRDLNTALDALLGLARFGAVTCHWIEPGGDRQKSHVDYPCHVRSGPFWEDDPSLLRKYFTAHQLNHVLPHFSVQALIASDKMGKFNGSTEVVPGSHLIKDVDVKILDDGFYDRMEPEFVNAELNQGDVLLFNRRLVHRGGKNISSQRRNSLIMQAVYLFGVGQHLTDTTFVCANLTSQLKALTPEQRKEFLLRICAPYPLNTIDRT